jgi:hypothetical protein
MELLRTDTTFRFLGLSRNGWVSIAAFLFGVGWVVYAQRRRESRTLVGEPTFFSPQPATIGVGYDDADGGGVDPSDLEPRDLIVSGDTGVEDSSGAEPVDD